jgi:trehalose 2-sulfotransferase
MSMGRSSSSRSRLYQSYIICSTPRSGSTLLCSLLESAGCGRPNSYFRRQSIPDFARDFGVPSDGDLHSHAFRRSYLEAVMAAGKAGTDIFGLRVMFETLDELSVLLDELFPGLETTPARFEKAFGRLLYVYLSREDKVAQAISLLKARQTGLWHIASDGSELERTAPYQPPTYDPAKIRTLVNELTHQDGGWREWFVMHKIEPVRLTYDSLSREPQGGLRTVLSGLGMDTSLASTIMPHTAKLADEQSENWISRFETENPVS